MTRVPLRWWVCIVFCTIVVGCRGFELRDCLPSVEKTPDNSLEGKGTEELVAKCGEPTRIVPASLVSVFYPGMTFTRVFVYERAKKYVLIDHLDKVERVVDILK